MYEDITDQLRHGFITPNDARRMIGLPPTKPMFYTARVRITKDFCKVHDVHKVLYEAILLEIQKDYPDFTMDDIQENWCEWSRETDYQYGTDYYYLVYRTPAPKPVYKPVQPVFTAEQAWERNQKNLEGWDDF